MQYIKLIFIFILLSFSSLLFANSQTKTTPEYSFMQMADAATIQAIANRPGYFKLTLNKVNSCLTYITDRPNRVSGIISLKEFLKNWDKGKNSFAVNPPNVAIWANKDSDQQANFTVELMQPNYNPVKHSISYVIRALPGSKNVLPTDGKFNATAIFIDVCISCIG